MGKRHPRGYVQVWVPGRGWVLEHRVVMERLLGRPLLRAEVVHHINGRRDDNRPENLRLYDSAAAHNAAHRRVDRGVVCALYRVGLGGPSIARALGLSTKTVHDIVTEAGVSRRPDQAVALRAPGGVSFRPDRGKWRVYVQRHGRRVWLGTFDTEDAARAALREAKT